MNRLTAFFLILLRVAIGWHLFVEGLDKFHSDTWTSAPYLREASGPLAPQFHQLAGDPVLDRMTPADGTKLPPALANEWNDYFNAFAAHYQLNDDQRKVAQAKFDELQSSTAKWLVTGTKDVTITSPWGPPAEKKDELTKDRVADYKAKLEKARDLQANEMGLFGKGASSTVNAAKSAARKAGADLQKDLSEQTKTMKDELQKTLTDEQKKAGPVHEPIAQSIWHWSQVKWADASVKYGLTIFGFCLIVGLFSRTSSLGGAVLLLLFFLAMPPFPGTPDNPKAEGHYLFINKNIIEMVALLALATVPTGRWVGLDGLVHALNPFRRRPKAPRVPPAPYSPPRLMSSPVAPSHEHEKPLPNDLVTTDVPPESAVNAATPSAPIAPTEDPSHGA
jgi:uncharacterized membrane protein YphA (DoxX/SURF4 family)